MATTAPRERYRLGDVEVDVDGATIRRGSERLVVPPRTFELLVALLRRYPDTVRRRELMETVWRDENVTDQTLSHRVMVLRRALGESTPEAASVVAERGFGYRVAGPVEALGDRPASPPPARRRRGWWLAAAALALVAGATVLGVLRPRAFGGGEGAYVTIGVRPALGATGEIRPVAAEIAATLTASFRRIRGLRVVAFRPDGAKPHLYVDGAASGVASAMELRLWLVDGSTGRPLWTRVARGHPSEILGQEDALVAATVEAVRAHLSPAGAALAEVPPRLRRLCVRGELGWLTFTAGGLRASAEAWEGALALDPGYAPAHAGLSLSESVAALLGYRPPAPAQRRAREGARRALEIDPDLPAGRLAAALVRLLFDFDAAGAEGLARRAALSDPEDLRFAIVQALVLDAQGRLDEAHRLLAPAIETDPHAAGLLFLDALGLQMDGRWNEAASLYDRALGEEPGLDLARRNRASCLAASRRPADALLALGGAAAPGAASPEAALRALWRQRCVAGGPRLEEVFRACLSSGDVLRASAALASSVEGRWPYVVLVPHDVSSAPLHESGAYRALLSRLASSRDGGASRVSASRPW